MVGILTWEGATGMVTRRQFVASGLATAALAAHPRPAGAMLSGAHIPLFRVLVDRTLAQSASFAAAAARLGAAVRTFDADIGRVWMDEIAPRWRERRGEGMRSAIAGLTAGATLFCLEILARDYGLHPVYRARHSTYSSGEPMHAVTGAEELREWQAALAARGPDWGSAAAVLTTRCPQHLRTPRRHAPLDLSAEPHGAERALYSWVIA